MPDIVKPSGMNSRWAESGLKSAPDVSKIDQGWTVEKPPYQVQNWLDNKQDNFNAHVNQHGIPYKDDETEYQAGKSYVVDPISGIVYKCIVTHVNQPVTNSVYWDIAFSPYEAMVPTGSTQMFAGTTAPRGWLIADGSAVSRTQYSALFAVIGTLYGSGDGTTTFNLPDMRGVVVRGVDRGRGLDPARTQATYQGDLFASHTHTNTTTVGTAGVHTHSATVAMSGGHSHLTLRNFNSNAGGSNWEGWGDGTISVSNATSLTSTSDLSDATSVAGNHTHLVTLAASGAHVHTVDVSISATGGSETRMKNIALLGIIKF